MQIASLQQAIRQEGVDGWLFCGFHHRDSLADRLLGIPPDAVNTRAWFCHIPAQGRPERIVHAIEASILDSIQGTVDEYTSRDELEQLLSRYAGTRVAMNTSEELPVISFLDAGTATTLGGIGVTIISAAGLIQRVTSLIDERGRESHRRAGIGLFEIIDETWRRLASIDRSSDLPTEIEVQRWMTAELATRQLETDHPPIVAAGQHSANPHHTPLSDAPIPRNSVVQFDIWAKESNGIYADISWVGYTGTSPGIDERNLFQAVTEARDSAVSYMKQQFDAGAEVTGAAVDRHVREVIARLGYTHGIKHRTGHGIDTTCHGSGVNLDSIEFPDRRLLLQGSLVSVEPGIYLDRIGMRTEIDVLIDGDPAIIAPEPQTSLLTF